jgi:hypothetical protein
MEIEEPPLENAFIPTTPDIVSAPKPKKKQAKRIYFDFALLQTFCNENGITLLEDYSQKFVTRNMMVNGTCRNQDCKETFTLGFRTLYRNNTGYCIACSKKENVSRLKSACLSKFGVDNARKCPIINEKVKQTCLEKYGYNNPSQNEDVKQKIKDTCEKVYGGHPLTNKDVQDKRKKNCLAKYGCENHQQNADVRLKTEATCLKKYGQKCSFESPELMAIGKQTVLLRYGCEYATQAESVKEKTKQTNLKKYGKAHPLQCDTVKEKSRQTSMARYGVEYPMQCADVSEKSLHKAHKYKLFTFPSGNEIYTQGYEHFALRDLLDTHNISEEDIVTNRKDVPKLWYSDTNNKKHRHFVDIYIPSQNKCIEIKSSWTVNIEKSHVFQKQVAAKKEGFLYEIWVYSSAGKLETIHT